MSKYTSEQVKDLLLGEYNTTSQVITELYGDRKEFPFELKYIPLEDKIKILDKYTESKSTYIFNLLEQFNYDRETLPQDNWGKVKTVSIKAWIRKNVDTNIIGIDTSYNYGSFNFLGLEHFIQRKYNYRSTWGTKDGDYREILFEAIMNNFKQSERNWYRENDPLIKKINELKGYISLSTFNSKILNDIHWNGKEDITEEQADFYINIGKEFEALQKILADKVADYELKNELI